MSATVKPLRVDAVDLSHHQGLAVDWRALRRAGVQMAWHKATEGAGWTDPAFAARRREARRAGFPLGAYHFARPGSGTPEAQAAHFVEVARPAAGDPLPALDLELAEGLSEDQLWAWANRFRRAVRRLTATESAAGLGIAVYGPFFGSRPRAPWPRWVPRYNDRNEPPAGPWDVWQFSNGVLGVPDRVAGYKGPMDLNHFRDGVTAEDLTAVARPLGPAGQAFTAVHASLQYSDTDAEKRDAVDGVFGLGADVMTGTEAGRGSRPTPRLLRQAAADHGYLVHLNPVTDAWVAVRRGFLHGGVSAGYRKVIPSSDELGVSSHRWGEKGIVSLTFDAGPVIGRLAVGAGHWLTHKQSSAKGAGHWNGVMATAVGDWALEAGRGTALVVYGCDSNRDGRRVDPFPDAASPMVTCWEEAGEHPRTGTGLGNIDFIATSDRDGRLSVTFADVVTDRDLALPQDHFPVVADLWAKALR